MNQIAALPEDQGWYPGVSFFSLLFPNIVTPLNDWLLKRVVHDYRRGRQQQVFLLP